MSRYSRHIILPEVGPVGQVKLLEAKVLVIGAGGLGLPVLQYLAAAGVGRLGIVDHDNVSISNLQRQVLFREQDLDQNKAEVAQKLLALRNSQIQIEAHPVFFDTANAHALVTSYDLVVDCTDNFRTRYLINGVCIQADKPFVFAAIYKFEGQLTVFNYRGGPSYRCLFPHPPQAGEVPNCEEAGVLGVLPGILGLYQANEVLKIILELDEVLTGKMMAINLLINQQKLFSFKRDENQIKQIKAAPLQCIALNDCKNS